MVTGCFLPCRRIVLVLESRRSPPVRVVSRVEPSDFGPRTRAFSAQAGFREPASERHGRPGGPVKIGAVGTRRIAGQRWCRGLRPIGHAGPFQLEQADPLRRLWHPRRCRRRTDGRGRSHRMRLHNQEGDRTALAVVDGVGFWALADIVAAPEAGSAPQHEFQVSIDCTDQQVNHRCVATPC